MARQADSRLPLRTNLDPALNQAVAVERQSPVVPW
jgi:hypothetical protein